MPSPELHARNSPGARSTQGLILGQECRAGGREAVRQSVEQLSWAHMTPRYGQRDWGTRLAGTHAELAWQEKWKTAMQRPEVGLFATSGCEEAGFLRLKSQSSALTPGNPQGNGCRLAIYFSMSFVSPELPGWASCTSRSLGRPHLVAFQPQMLQTDPALPLASWVTGQVS